MEAGFFIIVVSPLDCPLVIVQNHTTGSQGTLASTWPAGNETSTFAHPSHASHRKFRPESSVRGSYSAKVPRSSLAEVHREFVYHILEDQVDGQEAGKREDGERREESGVVEEIRRTVERENSSVESILSLAELCTFTTDFRYLRKRKWGGR